MKNFLTYFTLLIFIVLQSTVLRGIEVFHTIPNLILVFAVCYSMHAEPVKATALSLVAGLVFDLLQAHHLGLGALLMMLLGLALAVASSDYIHSNPATVAVSVLLSTFVFEGIYTFLLYVMFDKVSVAHMAVAITKEAVYNTIVGAAVMWWAKYLAEYEVRSF